MCTDADLIKITDACTEAPTAQIYDFFVRKSLIIPITLAVALFACVFAPALRPMVLVVGLVAAVFVPFSAIWYQTASEGSSYQRNLYGALALALILVSPAITALVINAAA
mgnify:FL=1